MDGVVSRIDGLVLLTSLIIFLAMGIVTAKKGAGSTATDGEAGRRGAPLNIGLIVVGSAGLVLGAHFIVNSAIYIARELGFSEIFIGISIVAVGTSLPELATSVVAGAKGESDLSVGNVVGSNIFNIGMVIGTVGLFSTMEVGTDLMWFEFPAMFALSVILFLFARTGFIINRLEGFLFLMSFFLFVSISYWLGKG
jgi:cation:H+ antiporter